MSDRSKHAHKTLVTNQPAGGVYEWKRAIIHNFEAIRDVFLRNRLYGKQIKD